MNVPPSTDHNQTMAQMYREQPEDLADMLNALMVDGDETEWRALLPQLQMIFPETAHAPMDVATIKTLFDLLRRLGLSYTSTPAAQEPAVAEASSQTIAA